MNLGPGLRYLLITIFGLGFGYVLFYTQGYHTRHLTHVVSKIRASISRDDSFLSTNMSTTAQRKEIKPHDSNKVGKWINGPVVAGKYNKTVLEVYSAHSDVRSGGHYVPPNVKKPYSVAIIAPYRERKYMLMTFLNYIHTFLKMQHIEYRIYISEQLEPKDVFARATAFNVGYMEAHKDKDWDCYFFHDIDMLPENAGNLYKCRDGPIHYSHYVSKWKYRGPYHQYYGGIVATTNKQFTDANGFSNYYWGWGGEDDDMLKRFVAAGYHKLFRQNGRVGRYTTLKHPGLEKSNKMFAGRNFAWKTHSTSWYKSDGLSTLRYELHRRENEPLYTWILASYKRDEMTKLRDKSVKDLETKDQRLKQSPSAMQYSISEI